MVSVNVYSLQRWHEVCLNTPFAIQEVLFAWEHKALLMEKVKVWPQCFLFLPCHIFVCLRREHHQPFFHVLIHISIIWTYVMNRGWLFDLHSNNLHVWHCMQTFPPNSFIPARCISTIDFYYFIPHTVTLTLPGVTRSAQSKTSWLHFLTHFWTDQYWIWCGVVTIQVERPDTIFEWELMIK